MFRVRGFINVYICWASRDYSMLKCISRKRMFSSKEKLCQHQNTTDNRLNFKTNIKKIIILIKEHGINISEFVQLNLPGRSVNRNNCQTISFYIMISTKSCASNLKFMRRKLLY